MIKKILVAAMLSASIASITATASPVIIIKVAPPPMRTELVPEARVGHVWIPGYWNWRNNRHEWIAGNWVRERRGYQYHPAAWVEHDGNWQMERGSWSRRDNDHDGVPNGQDRAPNNPNRH